VDQVAICGFYVQSYFCYRLWVISKRWYIVALVYTLFCFAFLSMVVAVRISPKLIFESPSYASMQTYFITVENSPQISDWCKDPPYIVFCAQLTL
jgi:hypothetical protein